jgi:hypothetical protein
LHGHYGMPERDDGGLDRLGRVFECVVLYIVVNALLFWKWAPQGYFSCLKLPFEVRWSCQSEEVAEALKCAANVAVAVLRGEGSDAVVEKKGAAARRLRSDSDLEAL